jgi:hypothetical protein
MMETSNKNGRIIPTNFGLKYNPPKLGVQYYFKNNPKATFVHEVTIEDAETNTKDQLINDLFTKHKKFIDPKVVSRNQLENLMDRLKSNVSRGSVKENTAPNLVELETNNKPVVNEVASKVLEADDFVPRSSQFDDFGDRDEEDHKNDDKDLMLDDFELGNEDQKVDALFKQNSDNDANNDLLGGLDDDFEDKQDKEMDHEDHEDHDDHDDNDKPTSNADEQEDEDDSDAIDIDNEEELAARGLKKIQIEGEEEEFLMDNEGNIYNLNGDFIGTTNGDADEEEEEANF